MPVPDTDGDGIADFLDGDSDDDGVTDTREAGGEDDDGDGMLDDALDTDVDGLADSVEAPTGMPLPLPDENRNGIPDYRDSEQSTDTGSHDHDDSCAVSPGRPTPSTALYLLFPFLAWIGRAAIRRRTAHER